MEMEYNNPYFVSITAGILVYLLYNNKSKSQDEKKKKEVKQMKLNYAFLTTIVIFFCMQFYGSEPTTIEPTLRGKFED